MMLFFKRIALLCSLLLLAQCSLFSPAPYQNQTTYELSAPCAPCHEKNAKIIYVAPMQAYPGLNTSAMRYTQKTYEVNYFSRNRWIDSPTAMIQPLLITHLQSTFAHVNTAQTGDANLTLKTTLLQFQQTFRDRCSQFHLSMKVEISDAKTGQVLIRETLDITEPSATNTPYGGVIAANKTLGLLFDRITMMLETA